MVKQLVSSVGVRRFLHVLLLLLLVGMLFVAARLHFDGKGMACEHHESTSIPKYSLPSFFPSKHALTLSCVQPEELQVTVQENY